MSFAKILMIVAFVGILFVGCDSAKEDVKQKISLVDSTKEKMSAFSDSQKKALGQAMDKDWKKAGVCDTAGMHVTADVLSKCGRCAEQMPSATRICETCAEELNVCSTCLKSK